MTQAAACALLTALLTNAAICRYRTDEGALVLGDTYPILDIKHSRYRGRCRGEVGEYDESGLVASLDQSHVACGDHGDPADDLPYVDFFVGRVPEYVLVDFFQVC